MKEKGTGRRNKGGRGVGGSCIEKGIGMAEQTISILETSFPTALKSDSDSVGRGVFGWKEPWGENKGEEGGGGRIRGIEKTKKNKKGDRRDMGGEKESRREMEGKKGEGRWKGRKQKGDGKGERREGKRIW